MALDFHDDLQQRGLIHQVSSGDLPKLLRERRFTGYIGFDPTADSLHIGSLMQVMTLKRFQLAGHRPIAVVGGGTGLIGDPSGKESERTLMSLETMEKNLAGLRGQLQRFLDFDNDAAIMVNNADWLRKLNLLEFLRDIGKHFSVNEMTRRDSVKLRLETRDQGISFTEFAYMLLQAFDFLQLYDDHGCRLQMGGSDQWGNILSGADLIRRLRGADAFGLTTPLMTRADGKKFGKTETGNVWLDAKRTSPYEFYQFWWNTDDKDVVSYLKSFTLLPIDQIDELDRATQTSPGERQAQRTLATDVTERVHGSAALARAKHATDVFFQKDADWRQLSAQELEEAFQGAPTTTIPGATLGTEQAGLLAVLNDIGFYTSRAQARKDLPNGSISINGATVVDPAYQLSSADVLEGGFVILRKGKRTFRALRIQAS